MCLFHLITVEHSTNSRLPPGWAPSLSSSPPRPFVGHQCWSPVGLVAGSCWCRVAAGGAELVGTGGGAKLVGTGGGTELAATVG